MQKSNSSAWSEITEDNSTAVDDCKHSELDCECKPPNKDGQQIWEERAISADLHRLTEADAIFDFIQSGVVPKTGRIDNDVGLLISAWLGKVSFARTFLQNGASVETSDSVGRTPLHVASCSGATECVELLLQCGASSSKFDRVCNVTPLHCAASYGHVDCLKSLLRCGADPNSGLAFKSALHYAVESKAVGCVKELLEFGATPNTPQVFSETPLHVAASVGSTEIIELLLKHGASFTVQCGVDKSTPLHLAAADGDVECVQTLLNAGATVTATNSKFQTPLHLAALSQAVDILELLLKCGADPNATDSNGRTPLHASIVKLSGSSESAKLLLKAGANVNKADQFGYTPLHLAALNEFPECVMLLLNYGGDMTSKTNGGVSVLTFIARRTPEVITRFLSKLDSLITLNDREIGDVDCELKIDFRILIPTVAKGETDLLLNFIEIGRKDVLKHPLCETFLFLKWKRIRKFFLLSLFYRTIFAFLYTFYILGVYLRYCPENPRQNSTSVAKCPEKLCTIPQHMKIIEYCIISLNVILLVKETFQVAHSLVIYAKEKENWVKWLNIITVHCSIYQYGGCDVAGVAIFLTWLELMLTVGRFPTFGLYIQMFKTVSINFSKLLMAYIFLLLGFALSFGVLFVNYKSFRHLILVIFKTFIMMSGELEYEDVFYDESAVIIYPVTAHAMTLLFVLLVTIILTNLLVGLAVNDIQGLQKSAGLDRLVRQTELVAHLEGVLFSRLLRWLPKRLLIFVYRRALLLKTHYRWDLYIKPNDPRERQIPKYIIKKIYDLASEKREKPKRKKRSDNRREFKS